VSLPSAVLRVVAEIPGLEVRKVKKRLDTYYSVVVKYNTSDRSKVSLAAGDAKPRPKGRSSS
jgi:hypothetical protein